MIFLAVAIANYLSLIGLIIGIAGGLGAAYAVARSGVATRTIALWKEQAEALEVRLTEEKEGVRECEERNRSLQIEVAELRAAQETWIKLLSTAIDPKIVQKMAAETRRIDRERDST